MSTSNLYTNDKIRIDRTAHHREVVNKIRISAVRVEQTSGDTSYGMEPSDSIWLPQIQVFAGVPILPRMTSDHQDGVQVTSNGGMEYSYEYYNNRDSGIRVFDREVSGTNIASVGSRAWYINNNHFLLEDVAENGNISRFGSYQSKGWLSLIFPAARLLGYLYSIDNLLGRSDSHANTSYAASLYFEGRAVSDINMTREPSQGNWDFIDLISLDQCLGHNDFGVSTASLIAQTNQTTINTYVQNLRTVLRPATASLPLPGDSFLMNRTDRHILRYNAVTGKWYDDGLRLEPGTTAVNQFNNLTTPELLAETGQARLNSVALIRGNAMQPPWATVPDKATIVNQQDAKRMMYDLQLQKWSEVPNNDAIYNVHDRTHYADLKDSTGNPLTLAQLRCTVQSIMNTEKPSVGGEPVAMPEMQFFGLPAETINNGAVVTVTYLKAEDSEGNLQDILGRHQRLPLQRYSYSGWSYLTTFRLYLGNLSNINANRRLYFDAYNLNGTKITSSTNYQTIGLHDRSDQYYEFSVSGDYRTNVAYYEIYVYSANNRPDGEGSNTGERIIMSSGYAGGQP
ncbi:MAG: hypothetical protein FWG73_02215 [Planctomycetaceae bacterium]|nr:hypothetical protein [Planctomycetaceae bacterium]